MKPKITLTLILIITALSAVFGQARSIENIGIGEISIIEMAGGNLWAGSASNGVGYYNAGTQTWTYYNHANTPQFSTDSITSIVARNGGSSSDVYIGTTSGIVLYKNGVWSAPALMAGRTISGLAMVAGDTIWVSTRDYGLAEIDTACAVIKTFTVSNSAIPVAPTRGGQRGGRSCGGFCGAAIDSGVFYTENGSVFLKYDTTAAHFGLVNNHVNNVWRDNNCNNDRWLVGTQGGFSICPDSMPCVNFTTANGLPQNNITALSQDCRGNVWLGTADSGVLVYNNPGFTRITTAHGLTSNQITAITFAAGSCTGYVATADGNIAVIDTAAQVTQVLSGIVPVSASEIDIAVYPQPASNRVNFGFGKVITSGELSLSDISGRMVQVLPVKNMAALSADVSLLPDGLYFYHLTVSGLSYRSGKVQVLR